MAEVQQVEVNSASHMRNQARVKRDEEELRELMKQAGLAQEDETQEEATDSEPDSESSEDTSVQAESVPKQEAKESAKAETQEADDTELSAEEKTFKQRYGDIRRHMKDKEQEWKLKFEKLEAQLQSAAKNELVLPKSEKEIEAWTKKYPDVAGIVEAIADKKAQERSSDIDKRLKEVEELRVTAKREKAEAELMKAHPDFGDIRDSDDFHQWADEQPKWVQDALYENDNDARSAARAIDLYKADRNIKIKKPADSKDAAGSVNSRNRRSQPEDKDSTTTFKESQVAKMSPQQYEKMSDQIMESIRTGKFIYDMSGSAR